MIFHPPAEPVVVKVASVELVEGVASAWAEELVREARILAAIDEHENIIRIRQGARVPCARSQIKTTNDPTARSNQTHAIFFNAVIFF